MLKTVSLCGVCLMWLSLILVSGQGAHAQSTSGLTVMMESHSYSESVSISGLLNDWSGGYHPGGLAYTRNEAAAIYQSARGWRLGVRSRYDYLAKFSEPLARFYYLNQQGEVQPTPLAPLYLEVQHLRASGLLLGFALSLSPTLTVGVDMTRWSTRDLLDGALVGAFRVDELGQLQADAALDYSYELDRVLDRPPLGDTVGSGWSGDVLVQWQPNNIWYGRLEIRDLISRIDWPSAPFTRAQLSTLNRFQAGEQVRFDPVVSGVEGVQAHTQVLPRLLSTALAWRPAPHRRVQVSYSHLLQDSWLDWNYRWISSVDADQWLAISVIAPQQAVGFTVNQGPLRLGVTTDAWDISKARWLSMQLMWQVRF